MAELKQNAKQFDLNKQKTKTKLEESDSQKIEKSRLENNLSDASQMHSEDSNSLKELIEPAIKTMKFRAKRGSRMKDLLLGTSQKDIFWDLHGKYFGGRLEDQEDSDDEQDYEACSSGRDSFDSDFQLNDDYEGKRGRKKGTKSKPKKEKVEKKSSPCSTTAVFPQKTIEHAGVVDQLQNQETNRIINIQEKKEKSDQKKNQKIEKSIHSKKIKKQQIKSEGHKTDSK